MNKGQEFRESNKSPSHNKKEVVIPVVHERVVVDKQTVETGKVQVRKTVSEETADVRIRLNEESYKIERIPINKVVETPPEAIRYEGDTIIIPVLREVVVVQKQYEIVEEVRLTKTRTETEFTQQLNLKKENVTINRTDSSAK